MSIYVEGPHGIFLASTAELILEDKEVAWAAAAQHVRVRKEIGYMMGRYIETDNANQNGHIFPLDQVRANIDSIVHTPLNMGHRERYNVGHYVAAELIYPEGPNADGSPGNAYVESLAAFWRQVFDMEWKQVQRANGEGSLFQSMECVPESLTCETPGGCGKTYPYMGVQSSTYCDELNAPRSPKLLNNPWFVGGGVILPPQKPGWKRANITELAQLVTANLDEAERIYDQLELDAPHLDPKILDEIMLLLIQDAYPSWAETHVTATKMPEQAGHGDPGPFAAGLAVVASDTGRVLLLQRALNDDDPASGKWEFPGGKIDDGEGSYEAARREFAEEVGVEAPGRLAGGWMSPNGVYHCFIHTVDTEADVAVNVGAEGREVLNPDDPDHDNIEVVAWWKVADAIDNPVMRDEVRATTPWEDLTEAGNR